MLPCSSSLYVWLSQSCPFRPMPAPSVWHPPRETRQVYRGRCRGAGVPVPVGVGELGNLGLGSKEKRDRGVQRRDSIMEIIRIWLRNSTPEPGQVLLRPLGVHGQGAAALRLCPQAGSGLGD